MFSNRCTLPSGVDRYLLTRVNSKVEKTKEGSLVRQVHESKSYAQLLDTKYPFLS